MEKKVDIQILKIAYLLLCRLLHQHQCLVLFWHAADSSGCGRGFCVFRCLVTTVERVPVSTKYLENPAL